MSAKHHNYLRTKRELTFKAKGLQLHRRLRRGHLPGDHHSCSATTPAPETAPCPAPSAPHQYERLEVWQQAARPNHRRFSLLNHNQQRRWTRSVELRSLPSQQRLGLHQQIREYFGSAAKFGIGPQWQEAVNSIQLQRKRS